MFKWMAPLQSWDVMWSNVKRGLSELTQSCRVKNLGGDGQEPAKKVCVDDCTSQSWQQSLLLWVFYIVNVHPKTLSHFCLKNGNCHDCITGSAFYAVHYRIYILYSTTDIGCVDWHLQMGDWCGLFTKHVSHLLEEELLQHNSQW
jgi:hypothetical protein